MSRCNIFGYAFSLVPLKIWQDFLIRYHMEKCPECQKKLVNLEEVQGITFQESQIVETEYLWDSFEAKLGEEKRKKKHVYSPRWRWAYGMAVFVVLVAAIIWVVKTPQFRKAQVEERLNGHFRINYIRIDNKPAQAYLFQPQDSYMIFVWAQKNVSGE
jgi:hypothetical protein